MPGGSDPFLSQRLAASMQEGGGTSGSNPALPTGGTTGGNPALVSSIFQNRCSSCHGQGSPAEAGINYITNLPELVNLGLVVPGDPNASLVFQMACGLGPCGPSIPKPELDAIAAWIDSLSTARNFGGH
jgi:hypothetical protein